MLDAHRSAAMPHRERYLFICTNRRRGRRSEGILRRRRAAKSWSNALKGTALQRARPREDGSARACSSGCLDLCEIGADDRASSRITSRTGRCTLSDVDEIVDALARRVRSSSTSSKYKATRATVSGARLRASPSHSPAAYLPASPTPFTDLAIRTSRSSVERGRSSASFLRERSLGEAVEGTIDVEGPHRGRDREACTVGGMLTMKLLDQKRVTVRPRVRGGRRHDLSRARPARVLRVRRDRLAHRLAARRCTAWLRRRRSTWRDAAPTSRERRWRERCCASIRRTELPAHVASLSARASAGSCRMRTSEADDGATSIPPRRHDPRHRRAGEARRPRWTRMPSSDIESEHRASSSTRRRSSACPSSPPSSIAKGLGPTIPAVGGRSSRPWASRRFRR